MTEELYINDECVDLDPDTRLTLNFKSNLLSDISKITASNSQTIRLPKTVKNRRIMDNPSAVAYQSTNRYKRYKANYIRNGVEVVRVAYAVLLSSSECYEIAIYWGVMANFQAWVDKGAKLNELAGTESLAWNKNITATTLSQMKSRGYGYAQYDCGISNTDLANIHPSSTAWWILTKIAAQAGFTIDIPDIYKAALREITVPCLSMNSSEASNTEEATTTTYPFLTYENGFWGFTIAGSISNTDKHGIFDKNDNTKILNVDNATKIIISISSVTSTQMRMVVYSNDANTFPSNVFVYATLYCDIDEKTMQIAKNVSSSSVSSSTGMYKYKKTYYFNNINIEIIWERYNYLRLFPYDGNNKIIGSSLGDAKLSIIENFDNIIYPCLFPIPQNLPEITQIDFIKAICGMLGIFAIADPTKTNNLKFVSLGVLQDNKSRAFDWSEKLVRGNDDEPKTVEFRINDYCRNNLFKYKEDDTVMADSNGNLKINSEVLEKEKVVLTLPFSASDGSKIPHYKLDNDGTKADKVQVKDRIMRLTDNGKGRAALTFAGLDFEALLLANYSTLSRLLNGAIVITERFTLNEFDLKSLDYTTPIYLKQYGRHYGVISIQASNNTCETKAVQLPETKVEEIIRPDLTVNVISVKPDLHGVTAISRYPLKTDLTVNFEIFLYDSPKPIAGTAVFRKNTTEIELMIITRLFDHLELRSVSPAHDDTYNYLIA